MALDAAPALKLCYSDNEDGTFSVSYAFAAAAVYSIAITLDGAEPSAVGSTLTVAVSSGSVSATGSAALHLADLDTAAGSTKSFTIFANDAFDNVAVAMAEGFEFVVTAVTEVVTGAGMVSQYAETEVVAGAEGQFTGSYSPSASGTYTVTVALVSVDQIATPVAWILPTGGTHGLTLETLVSPRIGQNLESDKQIVRNFADQK